MYQLYLSNTCPKGIAASEWLTARGVEFKTINLDDSPDAVVEHHLRLLIRSTLGDDEAPVRLPVLTRLTTAADEKIQEWGFSPNLWEERIGANEN